MLTILSVGYPLAPLGPDSVGGAEQVLSVLDRAIVDAGHRSIVVAPEGSRCRGELLPIWRETGPFDDAAVHRCHESCRRQIAHALRSRHIDVIHMHGVDCFNYLPDTRDVPVLATLHLWPSAYPRGLFENRRPNLYLQCVSTAQQRACPSGTRTFVIRNGVDLNAFAPLDGPSNYAFVLGRVCPDKGVHLAIDAAHAADLPVVIAGAIFPYPAHQQYFETEIRPRLSETVRFVGVVGGQAKRSALARARCLVVASVVPETSSLAAMEALACGTPVVALRSPALAELIEDGRTGFLVDRPEDLSRALRSVDGLSRRACRAAAMERCSMASMVRKYLDVYERLACTTVDSPLPGAARRGSAHTDEPARALSNPCR